MFQFSVNFYLSTTFHRFIRAVKPMELLAKLILKRKEPSKIWVGPFCAVYNLVNQGETLEPFGCRFVPH